MCKTINLTNLQLLELLSEIDKKVTTLCHAVDPSDTTTSSEIQILVNQLITKLENKEEDDEHHTNP